MSNIVISVLKSTVVLHMTQKQKTNKHRNVDFLFLISKSIFFFFGILLSLDLFSSLISNRVFIFLGISNLFVIRLLWLQGEDDQ